MKIKDLVVNIQSAVKDGEFTGMIQYDDGVTSIATRYTDYEKFTGALDAVYGFTTELNSVEEGLETIDALKEQLHD